MKLQCGVVDESSKYEYGWYSPHASVLRQKDEELFENKSYKTVSGKRDWVAFQVMLKADEQCTVSIGNRPAFSPYGPLENIRLSVNTGNLKEAEPAMYFEGLVEDDDRIYKSDILLHDEVVHVEKNKVQPVWVEISIPHNTIPGVYSGSVEVYAQSMFEDERKIDSVSFEIEVKDVLLPKPEEYTFYLDLWQHLSNIAREHEVILWSDEHFEIIGRYVESMGKLGQKAISIIASEIPWSGWNCTIVENHRSDMFQYNMIRIEKGNDFIYDFSNVERYIQLCFQHGIDKEIEIFGLISIAQYPKNGFGKIVEDYPDAIRVRYYDRKDGCYKYMRTAAEIREYFNAIEQFFKNKGWEHLVRIVADEPSDKEMYNEVLKVLSDEAPSFQYKTAINHVDFIAESDGKISDFVPFLQCISTGWSELKAVRDKIKGKLYWYVCCAPLYPNTFIKSPLIESRLIPVLSAFMNFDGFLRWNYTVWPENPREKIWYNYPCWHAGDTNFVYPAKDGRPLLTLRYKNFKRGIEDFELIEMVKKRHPCPEIVLDKIWQKLLEMKNVEMFYTEDVNTKRFYSLNPEDYREARAILLDALIKN